MEKKRDRSTKKQLYTLVDYISNNKDMVYPSNDVSTFNNYEEKWEDISKILNAMEGPKKTPKQWKSVRRCILCR